MHQPRRARAVAVFATAFLVGVGMLSPRPVAAWTGGQYSSADETQMLQLINQARASAGLKPLVLDSRLRGIAESRSSDFVRQRYFGHNIPTACNQVFTLLQQQGIAYAWAAE